MHTSGPRDGEIRRRAFLGTIGASVLAGCSAPPPFYPVPGHATAWPEEALPNSRRPRTPVAAGEQLMREHGMIGRLCLVYEGAAMRFEKEGGSLDVPFRAESGFVTVAGVTAAAARMIRRLVEEQHEVLEEDLVFSRLKSAGVLERLIGSLTAHHGRARLLTGSILERVEKGRSTQDVGLAHLLRSYARLSRLHIANEDMMLMPAFREAVDRSEYQEVSAELFQRQNEIARWEDVDDELSAMELALGMPRRDEPGFAAST